MGLRPKSFLNVTRDPHEARLRLPGGVVSTGTRRLCKPELGVRFPPPPFPGCLLPIGAVDRVRDTAGVSDAQLEAIKRAFDAFTKGDLEGVTGFIDPSFEIEDRILPEGGPAARGPDALVANAARVREVLGDAAWEPRAVIVGRDHMLIRVHVSGKGDYTSLPVDDDIGHMYTLRNGRAVRLVIYRTWSEALEAAGLDAAQTGDVSQAERPADSQA